MPAPGTERGGLGPPPQAAKAAPPPQAAKAAGSSPRANTAEPDTDAGRFRQVLGHFCTGVTIVTTMDEQRPAGFACQAFAALSLEPPLVLFCPSRSSVTWPVIARAGHFCANVLADGLQELARQFGFSGTD